MKRNRNPQNPTWASVRQSLRNHPKLTVLVCCCIIGSVITALLPPLVLEAGVNEMASSQAIPLTLALLYFALIVVADLFESAQGASITILGQKITQGLRQSLCEKLNVLPTEYFYTHDSGQTASLFVNDADTIDKLYSNGVIGMVADCFKIISILVVIFTRSIGLGIILLLVTPLLFAMTRAFQKRSLSAQVDNRKAIAKVNNHIPETIRNIRMIHVFSKEAWMESKYDQTIEESYAAVNRSNIYDSIYSPIIIMTQALVIAVMMISAASGSEVQQFFGLSVGSAVAVIAYVGQIFSPLESLGMEIQNIQSALSGIQRINEFLSEEEWNPAESAPAAQCENAHPSAPQPAVEFSHVTFGYSAGQTVLPDFSFTVPYGQNVTFMGRTGSGKSTIFRLLTGLYEPCTGSVTVNGTNPTLLPSDQRRATYGIVEQQFTAVPSSIRDQLALFDPRVTDDLCRQALDLVGLIDVVADLEKGLDTPMDTATFSQGQLQLLSIARAVATQPKILLLDEITANLDSQTEAQVLQALKNAAAGRTVLSISHRWSEALKDERIVFLD